MAGSPMRPWPSGLGEAARRGQHAPCSCIQADVAQAAARAADEMHKGAAWAQPDLAHNSLNLLEMRLRDLTAAGGTASNGAATGAAEYHRPQPDFAGDHVCFRAKRRPRAPAYAADGQQVLRRVRDYTHIGDRNAGLEGHIAAVGDPTKDPVRDLRSSGGHEIGGARPVPQVRSFQRQVTRCLDRRCDAHGTFRTSG